ncbi:MAG: family 10 glycosylhydrolase [Candidatus Cloacimonetes bacterium]|nr:family 10 glycosylhydrolase [Candidatus Cloacimonadota bacterium]
MKLYLVILFAVTSVCLYAQEFLTPHSTEIRSVWAMPWDINTPEAIDELIQTALDNNQNELLVEVRYRADALYDTQRGAAKYPNPEPQCHVIKQPGFDPLAYALDKAHAAGLYVHAWVIVFNATPLDQKLIKKNYIYQNHPDWLTRDSSGRQMSTSRQFGNFIDPGIPEAQDYLLNVFSNICAGYPDLDGFHLDYIRYPESNMGYHPVSLQRYKEFCENQAEITFNEWRIMQVNTFVERTYHQLKTINPRLIISAAVFADIADANVAYAQEWQTWLRDGYIDRIYPMAYNVHFEKHKKQVQQMKLLGKDKSIVVGLRAWDDNGRSISLNSGSRYTVADVKKRIDLTRELGFAGTALFSYAGLKIGNAWADLKQLCYSDTAYQQSPESDSTMSAMVDFKLVNSGNEFQIDITIPTQGYWSWEISDADYKYSVTRFYKQGENRDYWDGWLKTDDGVNSKFVGSGSYMVYLYQDEADFNYFIPIDVESSINP